METEKENMQTYVEESLKAQIYDVRATLEALEGNLDAMLEHMKTGKRGIHAAAFRARRETLKLNKLTKEFRKTSLLYHKLSKTLPWHNN